MTIYELKEKNVASGGHFFDRDTMKSFGDTMKNFGVRIVTNPPVTIADPTVEVYRKRPTGKGGKGCWLFNAVTGRMIA